jgi:Tfp pilus assembly PilM family ATPase
MNEYIIIKISKEYIVLASLRQVKDGCRLRDCFSVEISNSSQQAVAETIQNFVAKNSSRKPKIITLFPSNLIMSKNIEIPSTDKKEIKEIIDLQATRHTPYSRNEIVIDYTITGVVHDRYTKVMLIIVKKEIIEKQIATLRLAKCNPDKVLLESEVVSRWCADYLIDSSEGKPAAVVHFDRMNIDFAAVYQGRNIYVRSLSIDKEKLAEAADDAKQKLISELEKSLDAYNSENPEQPLTELYFIGLTAKISDFIEDIENKIKIKCQVYSYFDSVHLPSVPEQFKKEDKRISLFPLLAAPAVDSGLELNLIPEDLKIQKEIQEKAKDATKMGIFMMLIMVVFVLLLFTDMFFKNMYLEKLNQKYTEENMKANKLKNISERTNIVKRFIDSKGGVLETLVELVNIMPGEVYFNSINLRKDNTVIITSTADTMSRVFSLVTKLENNKNFKNVKIDFTKSRVVGGKEIADFGITMALEN